jgi:hypothetical protein
VPFKTDSAIGTAIRTPRWAVKASQNRRARRTNLKCVMAMEYSIGLMVLTTKDTGSLAKLRAKVHSGMPREMFTEENSKTTWPTVTENIRTLMDLATKESLKTMCKRVMARKSGSMEPNT